MFQNLKRIFQNQDNNMKEQKKIKRMFLDIEVSPNIVLSWGLGEVRLSPENIVSERAIICICYKWESDDTVHSLQWDRYKNDKIMLKRFMEEYQKADEVVFHNGDKFDMPWIMARCVKHDIEFFPNVTTIDTLKRARKFRFNSNKLDYLAQFFNVGAKSDTGGYSLWREILLDNNRESLGKMVDYCKNDVVILEKVYNILEKHFEPKTHVGMLMGKTRASCAHCGSGNTIVSKTKTSATGTVSKCMQCKDCYKYFTIPITALKEKEKGGN